MMSSPAFVHLRLHSEYSIVDGLTRIDDAVERAARFGMPALAVTDLANLFGMVKFYTAARARGVKPIIGCDVWVAEADERDSARDQGARLLLLVRNHGGYLRLCELLSEAYLAGRNRDRAEISRTAFTRGDNSGLIALSGADSGRIGQALLAGNARLAEDLARRWAADLPGSFYVELQRAGQPQQDALVSRSIALAAQLGLPVVATHPVQFLEREDFKAHEARVCIAEGYVLADPRRPRRFTEEQYFKSPAEMAALFEDAPEALANAVEIAKRCNLSIELGKNQLPEFPTPPGISLDAYLAREAQAGLERRLVRLYPESTERDKRRSEYADRLAFEIKTIQQMGFSGYFLIVADFINWAKTHGVPVGPGRGSGAGSLVAYALGITDLDPLRYELLFERFLNPERVSMPDFDVDFCQEGRDRVIDYVKRKYGAHAVSQIATFGTMAAKAVIRDVGRVLDLPFNFVDQFAKLIPMELGITLAKARQMEPQLGERLAQEDELRELWELAEKLEGLTRNVGMHAGGVLIAPGKLTDFCPLYAAAGADSVVSQFDKDDIEKVGLVKFDFLGLRTLTILDETVRLVKAIEGVDVVLDTLPLDDRETYDQIFKSANTSAVFQFESRGMKNMLVKAAPDRLEDLIALNALFRPGPMDLIPSFTARKHGRERVTYLTPALEQVLAKTYGIMVYQEQVMQTAQLIAGYSLGGADLLRRAMGKKKPEEMAKQREFFVAGAAANGISKETANEIFDYMEKFAGYGFNKSHAAAYSLIAYQTAWLKQHYPAAFMAATLSSEMADTDKVWFFCQDARANGLSLLPPDINASGVRFMPVDARTIRYGLGAVKGTGESALSLIVKARDEAGPFRDLFDFCARVDKRLVNRRVIEALIRAGAFDALDDHRARLLASLGVALEAAEQAERNSLQVGLFDSGEGQPPLAHYVETARWGERERLVQEKQALGFFLSGHIFTAYEAEVRPFVRRSLDAIKSAALSDPSRKTEVAAGTIDDIRLANAARGRMAIVALSDGVGSIEIRVFEALLDKVRSNWKVDDLLIAEIKPVMRISRDRDGNSEAGGAEEREVTFNAEALLTIGEARTRYARELRISMNGGADAERLRALLAPYRNGNCPVRLHYRCAAAECELPLGEGWRVKLEDELLGGLRQWLAPENVQVIYA